MSGAKRLLARSLILLLAFVLQLGVFMIPSIAFNGTATQAHAAGSSPLYSISHYVSFGDANTEASQLVTWATRDAQVEDPAGDNSSCAPHFYSRQIVAVLDFGQPARTSDGTYGIRNWLLVTYPYAQIEQFVKVYANQWYLHAGVCAHLTLGIGTNNSNECLAPYDATCVYNEGHGLAASVNDVENWVISLNNSGGTYDGFSSQVQIIGADDIENNEAAFDTYNQTVKFIQGFSDFNTQNHTSYNLLDYGDAFPCGDYDPAHPTNSCGNGNTDLWTYGEIYNVAWGLGWDEVIPEAYGQYYDQQWAAVYDHTVSGCGDCVGQGAMQFSGVMTDDGLQNQASSQATIFWSTVGSRGRALSTDWNTCMPGLGTSQAGGSAPCD